jgi:hypothetical protein
VFHNRFIQRALPRNPDAPPLGLLGKLLRFATMPLRWAFWRQAEILLLLHWRMPRKMRPKVPINNDFFATSTFLTTPEYRGFVRSGKIEYRVAAVERLGPGGVTVRARDGGAETELPADILILATGFEANTSPLDPAIARALHPQDDGIWLYHHILPPDVPGLAFVGSAHTFMNPLTFTVQAAWLAETLLGHITPPDADAMRAAIRNWQAKASTWPHGRMRSSAVTAHGDMYHEALLREMGSYHLARYGGPFGPLANLLLPVKPVDFAEAVKPAGQRSRRRLRPPRLLKVITIVVFGVVGKAFAARRRT